MRRLIGSTVFLFLLLMTSALAQNYSFSVIRAQVDIPSDYDIVLTPYNLNANASYLNEQGKDVDTVANEFEAEGILLQAFDSKNNRTLVLTALRDLDAQMYFDLNNQDEDMRKEFRVSHTNGTAYGVLGYAYSTAKWANYGKTTLRFLQTQYTLRQEGQLVCSGYQRRTIRNGYTITLDMQVRGRNAKEADNTALEKVMKTFSFMEVLPMPELPIKLTLTNPPPSETNEETFTVKGTSAKKAEITATVFSLGAAGGQSYTTTASNNGAFSLKITLPSQGVYSVTLTAEGAGALTAQRVYSVTFQKGILPVDVTQAPPSVLGDETVISGSTISGAKTQLSVSGPVNLSKTTTNQSFSFKVDTSMEGTYTFVLSVTKKGLNQRSFSYTATRTFSDAERVEKIRSLSKKISYSNLTKKENYGKYVVLTGYITSATQSINEWVVTLATAKSGSNYKDVVYLITDQEPDGDEYNQVRVYGTASGSYAILTDDGKIKDYPRVEVLMIEPAN